MCVCVCVSMCVCVCVCVCVCDGGMKFGRTACWESLSLPLERAVGGRGVGGRGGLLGVCRG